MTLSCRFSPKKPPAPRRRFADDEIGVPGQRERLAERRGRAEQGARDVGAEDRHLGRPPVLDLGEGPARAELRPRDLEEVRRRPLDKHRVALVGAAAGHQGPPVHDRGHDDLRAHVADRRGIGGDGGGQSRVERLALGVAVARRAVRIAGPMKRKHVLGPEFPEQAGDAVAHAHQDGGHEHDRDDADDDAGDRQDGAQFLAAERLQRERGGFGATLDPGHGCYSALTAAITSILVARRAG